MRPDVETDFLVIGSGAGGSVVAYYLARAGERVVVLERGKWIRPEDMSDNELDQITSMYKDGGSQTNTEADMFVLQGQVVGGSTVLTNAVCFRLPEDVRRNFANQGFELPLRELNAAYNRVESVLNVHELEEDVYNPAAWRMIDGMRQLGLEPGRFRKAMLNCIGCGYCNIGCRYGRKLDASMTWIPMAVDHGAEILPECEALKIETSKGAVTGVQCRDVRDGSVFRIRAKRYVLAGGAINSPELLLKSKILPGLAGRRTSFNAGGIIFAEYEEPVDGFDGDQMCVHHMTTAYAIEQVHNPPLSFAMTMPGWFDRHHADLGRYRNITSAGVLVPTQPVGQVLLGLGRKVIRKLFDHADFRFDLPQEDLHVLRTGLKQLMRIYLASGAKRVVTPAHHYTEIRHERDVDVIDKVIRSQRDIVGFGSSHPQGGACVGDGGQDVVTPDFNVRGLDNLYIADASLFPRSIRVNPMLTIMAVADIAAQKIGSLTPPQTIEEGIAWEARQRAGSTA
jgi:choline dehydrogenase-like flavoprotein